MVRKKTEAELKARSFRTERKKLAKQTAASTGKDVCWKKGRLMFQDTGKFAWVRSVPKPATASAA
ncbi:MAG: hypothetical protein AAB561_00220 [Patescibacteria group bacterium]